MNSAMPSYEAVNPKPSILIIDDNPANLAILTDYLYEHGFDILVARDSASGLKRAQLAQPDIILLDVNLPDRDGFETCHYLKQEPQTAAIPVIFITALADDIPHKVRGFQVGGVDYLTKPLQEAEILARLTTHLSLRNLTRQLQHQTAQLEQEVVERKRAETELQQHHKQLEALIQSRTTDLQQANQQLKQEIAERRQTEEALRKSETQLRLALAAANMGIWDWDIVEAKITWSDNVERIFSLEPGSFAGTYEAYMELIYLDDRPWVEQNIQEAIEFGHDYHVEHRVLSAEGQIRWSEGRGQVFYNEAGIPVRMIGAIQDITTRKQSEAEIRLLNAELEHRVAERTAQLAAEIAGRLQTETHLHAILDHSSAPIFLKSAPDGHYLLANHRFAELRGFAAKDIIGKTDHQLYPPNLVNRFLKVDRQIFETGQPQTVEETVVQSSGQAVTYVTVKFPLRTNDGAIFAIGGIATDITARKQAEERIHHLNTQLEQRVNERTAQLERANHELAAKIVEHQHTEESLRQSEELYRTLFETMTQGVVYQDRIGKIISANFAAERILGLTLDQMQDKTSTDPHWRAIREDGTDFPGESHPASVALSTGRPVSNTIMGVFHPGENDYVWINVHAMPQFRPGETEPYQVYTIFEDITERKRSEEQITTSLQEKEVLLKEIHHRVKNNLQIVSSLLYLQGEYIEDESVRQTFMESTNRIKSMALIHERLYQTQSLAKIDFTEYVEGLINHLFRSYGANARHISVQNQITGISLSLGIAIPCGLIINELVSNAIKHAFPGGKSGQLYINLQATQDHHLTLTVKDDGVGLPADVNYQQAKSLGLILVNTLVKQLKGTIELNQQDGTEFKITFIDSSAHTNN